MVSFFIRILECIFCCEDEKPRPSLRKSSIQRDYYPIPRNDTLSHSVSPGTYSWSSNQSSIVPSVSTGRMKASPSLTDTYQHRKTNNAGVATDFPASSGTVKSFPIIKDPTPSSVLQKPVGISQESSISPNLDSQTKKNQSAHTLSHNVSLGTVRSFPIIKDPTLSLVLQKPIVFSQNSSISPNRDSQTKKKQSEHTLSHNVLLGTVKSFPIIKDPTPSSVLQKPVGISQKSSISPNLDSQTKKNQSEHTLSHNVSLGAVRSFPIIKDPTLSLVQQKPIVFSQKSSISPNRDSETKKKQSEHTLSHNVLLGTVRSFPIIKDPTPSSVLQKPVGISQNSSISPNRDSQTKKMQSEHTLSHNVSSIRQETNVLKLLASSSSSRPSVSTSEQPYPENYGKNPAFLSIKPTISLAASNPTGLEKKVNYNWVENGASPTYSCPEDFKSSIKKDIVPGVLQKPLSMSTYKEYFQALLYAEDVYLENWDGFEMENVTLKLQDAKINTRKGKSKTLKGVKNVEKTFVEFELDKIRERRPFLLSRDFVTVRPTINKNKEFQGKIYRVVRSNVVLAEFEEDFYAQHDRSGAYDVKFSFNRICLKRAHQAISDASDDLFKNFLFPKTVQGNKVQDADRGGEARALRKILNLQGSPPYLLEGPLIETVTFVGKTILAICRASLSNRILLCAPSNSTCDMFMRSLKGEIPESDMFRANAAFREWDEVPEDILPSCLYKKERECFTCPSLEKLCKYKVVLSTYVSSFRLHNQGIKAGHFTHIFLADASSITEPETLVPLANFANEKTNVVVVGELGKRTRWIRSNIAKRNGLSISYFERICDSMEFEYWDSYIT